MDFTDIRESWRHKLYGMKYVLVTGGVVSGLGKGITASSIGVLLKGCGLSVTSIKIDPYLNKDAGTMSPYEHGEVFVLADGGEADLDLGNYERFLGTTLTKDHNLTTGKAYDQVITRERRGDYLGKTVQVVPHVTDAIQDWIRTAAAIPVDSDGSTPDVCIIELGGTVGDIESMVFLEALRQFRFHVGSDNLCQVHVSLTPILGAVGEPKSKPTQHSVRELRAAGLAPDLIVCRSSVPLNRAVIEKISLFCMVPSSHVVSVHDVPSLYHVPQLLLDQRVPSMVLNCLKLNVMPPANLSQEWQDLVKTVDILQSGARPSVKVALVGKYTGLKDSYLSVLKAIHHACLRVGINDEVVWVDASSLEIQAREEEPEDYAKAWADLKASDCILIPGGFGTRGVEGKILAAQYARENKVPYLGICLGMQVAVIEYARHVLGKKHGNSTEFDEETPEPIVVYMPEVPQGQLGGTMRLGSRVTHIQEGSLAQELYAGHTEVWERHRHRYEVNPEVVAELEGKGLVFSGKDDEGKRMEIIELSNAAHPFYFGCQFHPEFQSHPLNPSPPFMGFIVAATKVLKRPLETPGVGLPMAKKRRNSVANALSPPPASGIREA